MKRFLLAGLALLLVVVGFRVLARALASDETKVRRLVEQMEEGYDRGRPGTCVGPLAKEWRHEGYELDRELLKAALLRQSLQERDKETKEMLSRVTIDWDGISIEVEGDTATLTCELFFERSKQGVWEETWSMRAQADLERTKGGWKIARSRHEDLAGTQLSR